MREQHELFLEGYLWGGGFWEESYYVGTAGDVSTDTIELSSCSSSAPFLQGEVHRGGMHERAAEFADRARDRYGVDLDVSEFGSGTETAAAAAEAIGCETAAIASTIVVALAGSNRDGDLVAAITSGANRLDLDAVANHYGAETASMADPGDIRSVVGWSIGGVPPICHDTALPITVDPTLTHYDVVHAAAGTPSAVFAVEPDRLVDLANADVVDLTE